MRRGRASGPALSRLPRAASGDLYKGMAVPFRKYRIALLALAGVLIFGLAACGGGDEGGGDGDGFLAGVVSDVGRFNDRGFNQLALKGCEDAVSELGTECRAFESRSTSDYIPNFTRLVRDGAGLSVATGFLLADATNTAAERFPD